MKISLVARSFYFRTRRNDTWSSFDGTTGTSLERASVNGKGGPNGVEGGSNDPRHQVIPFFRSCHSDLIPHSRVVRSHSGRKEAFGMTSERGRNEGRGGAEVG